MELGHIFLQRVIKVDLILKPAYSEIALNLETVSGFAGLVDLDLLLEFVCVRDLDRAVLAAGDEV